MEKQQEKLIKCYEEEIKTSNKLIQSQRERIQLLEDEVKTHKEADEKLFTMLDETIELANKQITILPKPSLN